MFIQHVICTYMRHLPAQHVCTRICLCGCKSNNTLDQHRTVLLVFRSKVVVFACRIGANTVFPFQMDGKLLQATTMYCPIVLIKYSCYAGPPRIANKMCVYLHCRMKCEANNKVCAHMGQRSENLEGGDEYVIYTLIFFKFFGWN